MRWRWPVRWRKQLPKDPLTRAGGTFVLPANWDRTEELRPDRLGPDSDDVDTTPKDLERPSRTLGKLPWS